MFDLPSLHENQELVMSAAGFDGHSVTTYRFKSGRAPEQVAESVRERWHAEGVHFVETSRGEWLMLSSRRDAAIETLQLRRTPAGTEGLHSLWQREAGGGARFGAAGGARPGAEGSGSPTERLRGWLPVGARPIREIVHRDGPTEAATVVAVAADSVPELSRALKRRMTAAGFTQEPGLGDEGRPGSLRARRGVGTDAGMPAGTGLGAAAGAGHALAFRRGGEEVVATVAAHRGESAIVLHWSRRR